ncbi:MAG: hypothetical protein ACRDKL_08755, partial [Solirubrobacteraceae bacterium]
MSPRPARGSGGGAAGAGPLATTGAPGPRVALVQKRGRLLVAEPFFGPGPRVAIAHDSRYGVGDLVLVASAPATG